jgi:hypothetical protein
VGEITASTTSGIAKANVRRRRFLMLGVATLAVLGTILGISFTADTGSTSVSVTGGAGAGKLVYPISGASGSTMPSALNTHTLQNGTVVASGTTSSNSLPSWTPAAGVPGSVTTHGDLAVIDGTTTSAGGATTVQLTIYVTNLGDLGGDYTSWAFPISVWSTTNGGLSWTQVAASSQYITHTLGFLSYSLPTGGSTYFDVVMDTGGSFYTVSTSTASGHSLSPNFYFTAQPV